MEIWCLTIPINQKDWRNGRCSCPNFMKEYICKHLIGLAIRLKLVNVPPEAKDVAIGAKKKRGRPKKSTKALLVK
jgi:hypothetical protein